MLSSVDKELEHLRWRVRLLESQLAEALGRADVSDDPHLSAPITAEMSERTALLVEVERSVDLGTWVWHLPSNGVVWSPQMYEILGYDPEHDEASTEAFFARVHPDDVKAIEDASAAATETGEILPTEFRAVRPDGKVLYLVVGGATAFRDDSGNVTRLVGTIVDLTQRKRAEQALRRSEARLNQAQRIAHVGSWTWAADTGVVAWSVEMYRICGVDPSIEPTVDLSFEIVHPDDLERVRRISARTIETGVALPHDYRIVRPSDGVERHVHTDGEALRDADGTVIGFVGTLLDVTRRRELEQQLLHSQKLEAMGRLAGGVAHDFNNVLSAILGNVELVERKLPEESPHHPRVERIRIAAERAAGLTKQLLAFARREVVTPEVVETAPLLLELHQLVEPLLGEQVELRTSAAEDVWPVHIDRGQLQQVLVNLAVNARDAMSDGGTLAIEASNAPLLHGRIGRLPAGDYVRLDVIDDGEGMPVEIQAQVFDPFFTTKAPGVGTGLGLATCHGIVAQNGGHIAFHSELGAGTTFTLHLPRATDDDTISVADSDTLSPVPHGRETVLVLEDEQFVREMLVEALEEAGYSVLSAADGTEALRLSDQLPGSIHLLLSDVILPGMSGPQVAEKLRKQRPRMRVLYVTGYPDDQLASRGALRRGARVLQKPFTPDAVTRAVAELLAG